jgi:cysteine desulfurase/selenocysteine lyase
MPPFLTGGEMIESVTRESATYAPLPAKFEAGTVNAAGAVGLAAAIEYLQGVGFEDVAAQELKLTRQLLDAMRAIPHIQLLGADDAARRNGIVSFNIEGCHPHDVATMLDSEHICIRAGHHCAQPLLAHLGVSSSARASLYFYNTEEEVDRFAAALGRVRGWMGYKD